MPCGGSFHENDVNLSNFFEACRIQSKREIQSYSRYVKFVGPEAVLLMVDCGVGTEDPSLLSVSNLRLFIGSIFLSLLEPDAFLFKGRKYVTRCNIIQ